MGRNKPTLRALILLIVATAVLGEISFFPFKSGFRFGLGSAIFFLGILLYPELLKIWVGSLVGGAVVVFRVVLDLFSVVPHPGVFYLLGAHFPAFFYYLFLSIFLKFSKVLKYMDYPLILGLMVAGFDILANAFELLIWNGFQISAGLGRELVETGAVALGKGFIVIGIISIFSVYKLRIVKEQEKLKLERLLLLASGLYQETFFLKKAMGHIEGITAKSFELYQQTKSAEIGGLRGYSGLALEVAEEVHEVKKDVQRVVAGLAKLVTVKQEDAEMGLGEIMSLLIRINEDYSKSLQKNIRFEIEVGQKDINIKRVYPVISILNNLIANAIEAIEMEGKIVCSVQLEHEFLILSVFDDGPAIPEDELELIFQPGFTTKYNLEGAASTGIGLTHVKEVIELLNGDVRVESSSGGTQFLVEIPIEQVI